ncbi:recombinase family protein [Arthrobacter zhaoguopingii]|uniref:recombinase family protein n=1 Tax=Arthrobacter zhaoguopingii TaxID=2681491 RepID=UPI00135BC846|nr:recombinase family protein [Arthrobacter zhaoguopingii]
MTQRAFIYTRISQDRNAEGLGVQRQEEACRRYALQHGMEVVEVFSDNSTSAFSNRTRPAYTAMLERLRAREVEAVICWRMDRLHRRPIDLEDYAEVCQGPRGSAPILTYSVTAGGEIDLSTADGLLRAGIMGQVARFESATKSERARAKASQLAEAGMWTGGRRPFGWQVENGRLTTEPREAAALASAHSDVLAGRSLGSIIKKWNEEGWDGEPLLTTADKPWGYAQLRQALLRPRNAGLYVFHGEVLSRDKIPAIVPEDVWRAVVAVLTAPERRRSQTNKAAHLLAGIAQCHCGEFVRSGNVYGRRDKTTGVKPKHTAYRCSSQGRGHVGKREEYVDAVVELWVFRLLSQTYREEPENPAARAEADAIRSRLEALHVREQGAGGLLAAGEMTLGQMRNFNEGIQRQRADLEDRLTKLGLDRGQELDTLARFDLEMGEVQERFNAWLAMPIDDRRDFIRSKLHIVLHPHSKGSPREFDPDTVSVHIKAPGETRRSLSAADIAALERVSLGENVAEMLRRFRTNRRGSEYSPAFKIRESFAKLAEEHPVLQKILDDQAARKNANRA